MVSLTPAKLGCANCSTHECMAFNALEKNLPTIINPPGERLPLACKDGFLLISGGTTANFMILTNYRACDG